MTVANTENKYKKNLHGVINNQTGVKLKKKPSSLLIMIGKKLLSCHNSSHSYPGHTHYIITVNYFSLHIDKFSSIAFINLVSELDIDF